MPTRFAKPSRKRTRRSRQHGFQPSMEQMELRLVPSVVNVHAGTNLQAVLNQAQPGDQLILDAGATFSGPITLPNKAGDQLITIESSALSSLPAPGQRVSPNDAQFMPKITAAPYTAALQTSPGAHNYRLAGIEFLPASKDTFVYDVVDLGDGGSAQNSLSQVPHDITLDQCYIHTWLDQSVKRGIGLNSASTTIVNSYIAGFKVDGQDSQAIAGWNGPGPYKIDNNYLEGAGENVIFGGAGASIPNLIPSDIEIRNNLVTKPLAWNPNSSAYTGHHWTVKNLLELKNAQRVTIDGNDFENNWVDAQVGFAILLTPRGDQSGGPWATTSDVTFTNNIVRHSAQGINLLGSDDSSTSQITHDVLIQNNLLDDIGSSTWGAGDGRAFQLLCGLKGGTQNVTIDHNTVTSDYVLCIADPSHTGFVFTNNIAPNGAYGMLVGGLGESVSALQKAFPGGVIQNNVIVGGNSSDYPSGNFFPSSWQGVGFVNLAGADYHLASSSPYIGKGTLGSNPGANIDAILAAQNSNGNTPHVTPATHSLALSGLPAAATAGAAVTFTLTADDASGTAVASYRGTVHFSSNDSQAGLPSDYTFTAADNGVHTFSVTFKTAGTHSLSAADTSSSTITSGQGSIAVSPAAASRLVLAGFPASQRMGTAGSFTITALDANGNTATGYRGTVHFSSSDSQASLPSDYTFTATDNGTHTFSATFKTAGTFTLTGTDTASAGITGSQTAIMVTAAPANGLHLTGLPTSTAAGTAVSFTITATDANGNPVTSYRGAVHFSSSDSQASLPSDYTFTATDNGMHTFTATFKTAGTRSLGVAETTANGTPGSQATLTVNAAAANHLVLSGLPASFTAGTASSFTVTALDAFGNVATGYRGTDHFTSTDGQAVLPGNYTFTATDNGAHSFSATLNSAGSWALTATDTTSATVTGTASALKVTAPKPTSGPNVTYHGGPLLQHVQIESVYYGPGWGTDTQLHQQQGNLDGFLQYFVTSPYMNVLKQYNVSTGSFTGHDLISQTSTISQTLDDSQIRTALSAEINMQHVPAPTSDRLYVFFTAPGTVVTVNGQSSGVNFLGYHSQFTTSTGVAVTYAVIPYSAQSFLTSFQLDTIVLSHEIAEAVTDPDTRSGWFDPRWGEIGDIASGYYGVLQNYLVQGVWSQADNAVVIPFDVTFFNIHATGVQVAATGATLRANLVQTGAASVAQGASPGGPSTVFTTPSLLKSSSGGAGFWLDVMEEEMLVLDHALGVA